MRTVRMWVRKICCFFLIVFYQFALVAEVSKLKPVTLEEIRKVDAALPETVAIKPKQDRKVLIFSKCEGWVHECIPIANYALKALGEKTGAYSSVLSDDMDSFLPEFLNEFDAVIFNNSTRLVFLQDVHRKALLDFMNEGHGLIVIHAGSDNFYTFPEMAELVGGQFNGHPWLSTGTWAVKLDEPAHLLNRSFGGKGFLITDEIYQFNRLFLRSKVRVLMSLDMSNLRNWEVKGMKRKDKDFAISWIRESGKTRVFNCNLGHNKDTYWNSAVLQHYLDGIQFALGDYDVDASPSAGHKFSPALTTDDGAVEDPVAGILKYQFDGDLILLRRLQHALRFSNEDAWPEYERRLLRVIQSKDASYAAKDSCLRVLREIASEQSVSVLSKFLLDESLSAPVRGVLQKIDHSDVDHALYEALRDAKGEQLIGLIHTIGQRKVDSSAEVLEEYLNSDDVLIKKSAIEALGKIGGDRAARLLIGISESDEAIIVMQESLLLCGDRLLKEKRLNEAKRLFSKLVENVASETVETAAYIGLAKSDIRTAPYIIIELFDKDEDRYRKLAGQLMQIAKGAYAANIFIDAFPNFSSESKIAFLQALQERGLERGVSQVKRIARKGSGALRLEAIRTLGTLGNDKDTRFLSRIAASATDELGEVALQSLIRLKDPGVDEQLGALLKLENPKVREVGVRVLQARNSPKAMHYFLDIFNDSENAVRQLVFKGISSMAKQSDLPDLIELLQKATEAKPVDNAGRLVLEKAILRAAIRGPRKQCIDVLHEKYPTVSTLVRISFLKILGKIGDDRSFDLLEAALKGDDVDAKSVALRAFASWPNDKPLELLRFEAKHNKNELYKFLALQGYVKLAGIPGERAALETLDIYRDAMAFVESPEEKRLVINACTRNPVIETLTFLEEQLEETELSKEVKESYRFVYKTLSDEDVARRKRYVYSAFTSSRALRYVDDGDSNTFWSSVVNQAPGHWFVIDLKRERAIERVSLDPGLDGAASPKGADLFLSNDGNNWGEPVAKVSSKMARNGIDLDKQRGRFIKIVLNARRPSPWKIKEVHVETVKYKAELGKAAKLVGSWQ